MVNPFWNSAERRVRALWRILLQFALLLAVGFILDLLIPGAFDQPLTSTIALLVVITLATWVAARLIDRRKFRDLGLYLTPGWWMDFGFGLALGVLLMGCVFLIEYALGWAVVSGTFVALSPSQTFLPAFLSALLVFVCVGFYEELLSRGYHLTNMAEGLNLRRLGPRTAILLALLISSSIFGLGHATNPNASAISTINIILAGFLLGLPYVLTGRLAASIGLHITWNFAQGVLFGFPVSGSESIIAAQVIATDQVGPPLWTGGAFGPEAGLMGILAMLLGAALIVLYTRSRYGQAAVYTSLAIPPLSRTENLAVEVTENVPTFPNQENPKSKI